MPHRIIFPSRGETRFESFAPRPPAAGEALVRTLVSLMSIGTETTILHGRYDPGTHFAARFSFPQLKTGVQAVGVVEACGEGAAEFAPGSRVYMRMAHASHATLPTVQLTAVPADLEPRKASWCGLAKTAFRAAQVAPFTLGGQALVIGAGPVGQMAVRWARVAGMATIAVADLAPLRLTHALAGGATATFRGPLAAIAPDLLAASGGDGFPVVVDTTGNPAVFAEALGLAGLYGTVVLLGDTGYPSRQTLTSAVMTRGLSIVATHDHHDRGGWTQRKIDALFFAHLRTGTFSVDGLITHEFAPERCAEAYALATERRDEAVGILFDWSGTR